MSALSGGETCPAVPGDESRGRISGVKSRRIPKSSCRKRMWTDCRAENPESEELAAGEKVYDGVNTRFVQSELSHGSGDLTRKIRVGEMLLLMMN